MVRSFGFLVGISGIFLDFLGMIIGFALFSFPFGACFLIPCRYIYNIMGCNGNDLLVLTGFLWCLWPFLVLETSIMYFLGCFGLGFSDYFCYVGLFHLYLIHLAQILYV